MGYDQRYDSKEITTMILLLLDVLDLSFTGAGIMHQYMVKLHVCSDFRSEEMGMSFGPDIYPDVCLFVISLNRDWGGTGLSLCFQLSVGVRCISPHTSEPI